MAKLLLNGTALMASRTPNWKKIDIPDELGRPDNLMVEMREDMIMFFCAWCDEYMLIGEPGAKRLKAFLDDFLAGNITDNDPEQEF